MRASGSPLLGFSLLMAVFGGCQNTDEGREFLGLAESRLVDFEKQKKKRAAKENALYLESFKALLAKGEEQLNNQLKELSDVA